MRKFLAVLVAIITPVSLWAGEISVNGSGSVSVSPDNAYIQMSVITEAPKPSDALSLNNVSTNKIFTSLTALGIKKSEIQSQNLNLIARYEYPDKQPPKLTGYKAVHSLQITVCKIEDVGKVLDTVVKDGANHVAGITFGLSADKMKETLKTARKAATNDAIERTDLYCAALGVKNKELKSFTEHNSMTGGRTPYSANRAIPEGVGTATNVEGGEITVTVQVLTIWTIDQLQK